MARVTWGTSGERYFETGVDRGVLYIPGQGGVPWNGLTAINESTTGGDPKPLYIDGYKYLNFATAEEFQATLSAMSSPPEFSRCDGVLGIHNGLFATQQPRAPFSLAYRTLVGNDILGVDHAYKLHMVYNALAAPSSRSNTSTGSSTDPMNLSWALTTQPPRMSGIRPTAHLVVDSRSTPEGLLQEIEDILYGTDTTDARIPEQEEIFGLFVNWA